MKHTRRAILFAFAFSLLFSALSLAHAQGAGVEWDALNREVMELYRAGEYDRAVAVAQKALHTAERNVGPDHPDVATSLENLAALYRALKRDSEAEALEQRAARIRPVHR